MRHLLDLIVMCRVLSLSSPILPLATGLEVVRIPARSRIRARLALFPPRRQIGYRTRVFWSQSNFEFLKLKVNLAYMPDSISKHFDRNLLQETGNRRPQKFLCG